MSGRTTTSCGAGALEYHYILCFTAIRYSWGATGATQNTQAQRARTQRRTCPSSSAYQELRITWHAFPPYLGSLGSARS